MELSIQPTMEGLLPPLSFLTQSSVEMTRILLIEDNNRLAKYVVIGLTRAGFSVDAVGCAEDGEEAMANLSYEAIVLDVGLPGADGFSLLSKMRGKGNNTFVLLLTARDEVQDRVFGLTEGADDYLVKPFAMDELVARIRNLLRRPRTSIGKVLIQGNVQFDIVARELSVKGNRIHLSRRELDALELLLRRSGRVVSKRTMEEAIYPFGEEIASNTIEVLIHRIRKRMQDADANIAIRTLRGIGYILNDETL
jgi:DNA-binding response OmpR family regulator